MESAIQIYTGNSPVNTLSIWAIYGRGLKTRTKESMEIERIAST